MGDAVIFALLFMTYSIMVGNTAGGPTGRELFSLDNAALETVFCWSAARPSASLRSPRATATAARCSAGWL